LYAALENTLKDEKQAPLYFWVLSLWRAVNGSIVFARIFSIICSCLAIGFFYQLANKIWNEKVATFAAFFFALHPYLFWASLEIRVYSLVVMFTTLLLLLFFDGYLNPGESQTPLGKGVQASTKKTEKAAQYAFCVTAIISLYVNYYHGFILVGCFVTLLLLRKWRPAKAYFLQMLIVAVFFLPLLWTIVTQLAVRNSGYFPPTSAFEGIKLLWGHFLMLVLPTETFPPEFGTTISYVRLWFVRAAIVVVVALLAIKRKLFDERILIFATLSITVFAFLYLSYFMLGETMVGVRHVSVLFVPLMLLLISVILAISPKTTKRKFYYHALIGTLLISFYSYALFSLYPNLTKQGDWARVGKFIEQNEDADQPIFIFPNFEALALPYYYRGINRVLPNDNFHKWFSEAEHGSAGMWTKQSQHYIGLISKDKNEIWLVTEEACHLAKSCHLLEKYVEENYTVVLQKDFYKERVRLLRRK
jgi:uncharacterized membrane protein